MQSTKTTEEIAKALCVDEQVHGIGVEASRTKLYNEEGIFVSRKKARNLVEKADHEIREKAGTTELSDHDKMVEVLDNDPNIHYFMQVAVVDSISDKVQKTFTVLKVGKVRCMLGVACSMTYILWHYSSLSHHIIFLLLSFFKQTVDDTSGDYKPKKVNLDVSNKGPGFFDTFNIHDYVTGKVPWPCSEADEKAFTEAYTVENDEDLELEFRLVSLAYSTTDELIDGARYPELIGYDTTFNTNKYNYKLAFVTGCNSSSKNINLLGTIINRERKTNFEFVFNQALPLFYGKKILRCDTLLQSCT